ncbi:MAG TPA: hypothetical protein VMW50_06785 [Dehalococcoidia bacterium]|jgi:hypothetical protein|nr:hypothetical protein [Dehalococcoidia bacterium]
MEHGENKSGVTNFVYEGVPLVFTSPEWNIVFQDKKSKEIGRLSFDKEGDLHFKGNATEAAKVFFTAVVNLNNQRVDDVRSMGKMGYEVVQDFLPNIGRCALQDYGRLNDFMILAAAEYD